MDDRRFRCVAYCFLDTMFKYGCHSKAAFKLFKADIQQPNPSNGSENCTSNRRSSYHSKYAGTHIIFVS